MQRLWRASASSRCASLVRDDADRQGPYRPDLGRLIIDPAGDKRYERTDEVYVPPPLQRVANSKGTGTIEVFWPDLVKRK